MSREGLTGGVRIDRDCTAALTIDGVVVEFMPLGPGDQVSLAVHLRAAADAPRAAQRQWSIRRWFGREPAGARQARPGYVPPVRGVAGVPGRSAGAQG